MTARVQNLTWAWNNFVSVWKATPKNGKGGERNVPVRMRGYSEVVMADLLPRERKEIDSALRRGYRLSNTNRASRVIDVLQQRADFRIGYLGKTKGFLWFPDSELRDDCMKLMEAQLVMTDKFSASAVRESGKQSIRIQVPTDWSLRHVESQHLKAHLKELRIVVDEFMAKWARDRERFADTLTPDTAVVRIPFDSRA